MNRFNFGDFKSIEPLNRNFGSERGKAVCHYYIHDFLEKNSSFIKGRVLEFGEDTYTKRYGGEKVISSDILHVNNVDGKGTIVADISKDNNIPSDYFDCIICTQTLQCIYDLKEAMKTLHRILKPGGVLLSSFSGISQVSRYDMDRWGEYWRFSVKSVEELLSPFFVEKNLVVKSHGNVLSAISYLFGLSSDDLKKNELLHSDPDYPVIITAFSEKKETEDISEKNEDPVVKGWNDYAKNWRDKKFPIYDNKEVKYLGDEWTFEDDKKGGYNYDLPLEAVETFENYIEEKLLNPFLGDDLEGGLEIGPGGGRLSALLLKRTRQLNLVESSKEMISILKKRFKGEKSIQYFLNDGKNLPHFEGLDYVFSFDVFVHFEPRLIFWYLKQIKTLLKKSGIGIIHYSDIRNKKIFPQFENSLPKNLIQRTDFAEFGVMCPQIMETFLDRLDFEIIESDLKVIPRDSITVFRKK